MKRNKFLFTFVFFAVTATSFSCNPNTGKTKVTLSNITVSLAKQKWSVGNTLYKSNITVYAVYSDKSDKKLSTDEFTCTCSDFEEGATSFTFSESKTYNFNISYLDKSKTLSVPVGVDDEYTVFIYMCASTLEYDSEEGETLGCATDDLNEILNANAIPYNVNLVIDIGGTTKWAEDSKFSFNPNYIKRYHVESSGNKNILTQSSTDKNRNISYNSTTNMGDESILTNFLVNGINDYPAQKYALILWDHGGGIQGVCFDDKYYSTSKKYDLLYTHEVTNALKKAKEKANKKFEWIGYDACLMAVQDIMDANSQYCNYMVASQENEPSGGWDYTSWLNAFYNNVSISTPSLLTSICTSYKNSYDDYNVWLKQYYPEYYEDYKLYATLSAFNLSYANAYKTAWDAFSEEVKTYLDSKTFTNFTNLFESSCMKFGASLNTASETIYPYDVFDVNNFSYLVSSTFSSIASVRTALKNLVITAKNTDTYTGTYKPCGLSLFCPTSHYADKSTYTSEDTRYITWRNVMINKGNWYVEP